MQPRVTLTIFLALARVYLPAEELITIAWAYLPLNPQWTVPEIKEEGDPASARLILWASAAMPSTSKVTTQKGMSSFDASASVLVAKPLSSNRVARAITGQEVVHPKL